MSVLTNRCFLHLSRYLAGAAGDAGRRAGLATFF
jgi:hypothetical protein